MKSLFFLSYSLSKTNESNTSAEKYLDKIAQTLRESTGRYFPHIKVKRNDSKRSCISNRFKQHLAINDKLYGSEQNSENDMKTTKRNKTNST